MRGKWVLISVTAILLGVAAGALSVLLRTTDESPTPGPPEDPAATATAAVEEISLSGLIRAQNVVGVTAPIEGTLENVMVAVGEEVFANQLLAQIKNTSIEADVEATRQELQRVEARVSNLESMFAASRLEASRASADLSRARNEYLSAERAALRQQMLYREGATPRLVYEEVQAEFKVKQEHYETLREVADLANERVSSVLTEMEAARRLVLEANEEFDIAGLMLLASEVVSPVDGILTGMSAAAGDEVHPEIGDLFRIAVDLMRLEVVLEPEPPVLERTFPGQPAQVYLAEVPGDGLPASVKEVKDGLVVVEFISPTPAVMPGLTAQVTIGLWQKKPPALSGGADVSP